eukprot:785685_1
MNILVMTSLSVLAVLSLSTPLAYAQNLDTTDSRSTRLELLDNSVFEFVGKSNLSARIVYDTMYVVQWFETKKDWKDQNKIDLEVFDIDKHAAPYKRSIKNASVDPRTDSDNISLKITDTDFKLTWQFHVDQFEERTTFNISVRVGNHWFAKDHKYPYQCSWRLPLDLDVYERMVFVNPEAKGQRNYSLEANSSVSLTGNWLDENMRRIRFRDDHLPCGRQYVYLEPIDPKSSQKPIEIHSEVNTVESTSASKITFRPTLAGTWKMTVRWDMSENFKPETAVATKDVKHLPIEWLSSARDKIFYVSHMTLIPNISLSQCMDEIPFGKFAVYFENRVCGYSRDTDDTDVRFYDHSRLRDQDSIPGRPNRNQALQCEVQTEVQPTKQSKGNEINEVIYLKTLDTLLDGKYVFEVTPYNDEDQICQVYLIDTKTKRRITTLLSGSNSREELTLQPNTEYAVHVHVLDKSKARGRFTVNLDCPNPPIDSVKHYPIKHMFIKKGVSRRSLMKEGSLIPEIEFLSVTKIIQDVLSPSDCRKECKKGCELVAFITEKNPNECHILSKGKKESKISVNPILYSYRESSLIHVSPGPAHSFTFDTPSVVTYGKQFAVRVRFNDSWGNVLPVTSEGAHRCTINIADDSSDKSCTTPVVLPTGWYQTKCRSSVIGKHQFTLKFDNINCPDINKSCPSNPTVTVKAAPAPEPTTSSTCDAKSPEMRPSDESPLTYNCPTCEICP